ncbi:hypothetical protein [Sphingosinicella ginsenosidimutans]|uniref:hypothetical protein n=1 Tax=Allosphingosinicella ginsenosidimutans TaxID=1176539 RepID=UPI0013159EAD|nr:hypothetical protein [Sphingosinicella ginsenosidimutans]
MLTWINLGPRRAEELVQFAQGIADDPSAPVLPQLRHEFVGYGTNVTTIEAQQGIVYHGRMTEAAVAYCNCMEDVKARLRLIKEITEGRSPLGSEGLDGEVVCLLLRKVLEQIAFSSLIAHRETYEAVHNDLGSIWRAKRLLERMDKLHPEFYPSPIKRGVSRHLGVHHHFDPVEDGFLTKDEFVFLYDTASSGIHTWNPFKDAERVLDFQRPIAEWIVRIAALLDHHLVHFAGTKDLWLIQMDSPEDHRVHAFVAPMVTEFPPVPA